MMRWIIATNLGSKHEGSSATCPRCNQDINISMMEPVEAEKRRKIATDMHSGPAECNAVGNALMRSAAGEESAGKYHDALAQWLENAYGYSPGVAYMNALTFVNEFKKVRHHD